MSQYLNVGARLNGADVPSKKALREAVAAGDPGLIFYTTSIFDETARFGLDAIPAFKSLSVVGPNPYSKRSWYATVEVTRGGIVRVK